MAMGSSDLLSIPRRVSEALFTPSEITVDSGNGHGSTYTKFRRFQDIRKNIGNAITYSDSAAFGASFRINTDGVYSISYHDLATGGAAAYGISVNTTSTITSLGSLSYAQGKRVITWTPGAGQATVAAVTLSLNEGDVIRAHTSGDPNGTDSLVSFTITRVR